MIVYHIYKLYYLLVLKIDTVIPTIDFTLPNYHTKFQQFIHGLGYFLPLTAIGQLFTILVAYQGIRLAIAFIRLNRR